MCVASFGLAPSEFWKMSADEVSLFLDASIPEKTYGALTQSQVDEIYNEIKDDDRYL